MGSGMNNRTVTLSIAFALIAVFFMNSYVSSIEDEARKRNGTEVLVLEAKKDISEMETINESMLEFKLIPKKYLEPSAVSLEKNDESKEGTKAIKSLAGSISVVPIKKGEQITYNKITEPGSRTGLATQVTPGKRAFSIPVNDTSGVSRLIKPGDRIDLIAVIDVGGGKESKVAKTVLQDVVVLATGHYITNNIARSVEVDPTGGSRERVRSLADDYAYSTLTVEVDPVQVQTLAVLVNNGENALSIALRNNDDLERVSLPMASLTDIVGAETIAKAKNQGGRR